VSNTSIKRPVLIIGAGDAGELLVRQLRNHPGPLDPVAFIDDDAEKHGLRIEGLPVVGGRASIPTALTSARAFIAIIAIPSAAGSTVQELTKLITDAGAQALIVPNLHEIITGGNSLPVRSIGIGDLLGRGEVPADFASIRPGLAGKTFLVTGASGSIGSEICRQLVHVTPREIVMLDMDESGLANLRAELGTTVPTELVLQNIVDAEGVARVMSRYRPDVVIHSAAYKHVDILEQQPLQAAAVNVLGTWNLSTAAEENGVDRFIFISTDKAVEATGILGASKRIGELLILANRDSSTKFCAVRFGNVLGSRGSVIPLFERQLTHGGPITITDPKVRRYFMSIPEAVHLVLKATVLSEPGSIYVLDMGEDVPVVSIAERLAGLRGLRIPEDVEIVFTGLRPGERLDEALMSSHEHAEATRFERISKVNTRQPKDRLALATAVDGITRAVSSGDAELVSQLLLRAAHEDTASQ